MIEAVLILCLSVYAACQIKVGYDAVRKPRK